MCEFELIRSFEFARILHAWQSHTFGRLHNKVKRETNDMHTNKAVVAVVFHPNRP